MNKTLCAAVLLGWSACLSAPAFGQSQSFTGSFSADADNPAFGFTLSAAAPVTVRTYSYAGGTNKAGTLIPAGGFDPTISLYDDGGNFIVGNRDGGCGNVAADAVTSFCWDSFLNVTLPAGVYTVVVTQSENLPNGPTLASSFVYAGQPNFTTPPGAGSSGFWDLFPSKRTSAYALDVISSALVTPALPPPVNPPTPLSFTSSGALGGFVPAATISGTFAATGGSTPYVFSAIGLPAGLSLDAKTGAFSGTGGNPGVYNFTVKVTDSESPVVTASLAVSYSVLGITTSALPIGSTTAAYSATVAATGGTGPYVFSATGLPGGLSISSAGAITGTPKASGTFTVVIQVASGGLTTSSTFPLAVSPPVTQPLLVSAATLPAATVSIPYSATTSLQATGGAPPYTWSVFGGIVPVGMSLSSSGNLQGTPTLAGTYAFTAQATDATGVTATGTFSLVVNSPPLIFSLGTFPTGVAGSEYPLQILTSTVTGGQPGYTFTLTTGTLPAGLLLKGQEISGTPGQTSAGTYPFVVTVTDAAGKSVNASGSITIVAAQPTLILSETTVSFALTAGASGVPTPAHVTLRSSVIGTQLPFTFAVSPVAPWLDVSGGNITPGALTIALDPTAPSLAASATAYTTNISVTCVPSTACGGLVQNIAVALAVTAPPPLLTLNSSLLSFTAYTSSPVLSSQSLGLQNSGGGTIDISSVTTGATWLTVTGVPSTLNAGPATSIAVSANPAGLSAGYYETTLTVNSSAGSLTIPVTLLVTGTLTMNVNPSGTQFSAPTGSSPGDAGGSFNVSATGAGTVNWSAALAPGSNWITLNTASGTSTAASAGVVGYSLNPGVITALAPATYFATINVSATGVADPLQQFQVVLNVTAANTTVTPVLSAAGLIFTANAAVGAPSQNVQVYATAGQVVTAYQASASTTDGASWLTVTPATGFASILGAAQSSVSVNVAALAPGVYSGGVSYAFSSDAVRTVNVTLLVLNSPTPTAAKGASPDATPTCTPSKLIGTQTSLYNNFAQAAGWPTPLSVNLMNDCGSPVNGAALTTTFSNGDPPMALSPRDSVSGIYVGTWTPRNVSSQVTVTATATASPLPVATALVTGAVRSNVTPALTPNGTLDVFNPVVGSALAPGQVVQIYGTNLAASTAIAPVPLPTALAGTMVLIGGIPAPLFYVSAGQIDAQIPFGLNAGSQYQIIVDVNGSLSTPLPIQLGVVAPSLANLSGAALAEHLDGTLVTATSPAQPSEYIVLYLSGLGATTNAVPSGAITPSNPNTLSIPLVTPTLTLNGANIPIAFVGLTPTAVGLYQIDFQMPASIAAGNLPLLVMQGGTVTNTVLLPTQ